MKTRIAFAIVCLFCLSITLPALCEEAATPAAPSMADNELVKSLSSKLGIKPEQAAGGAGSIFNYAKGKLSADDFKKLSSAVPGMDQLIASTPKPDTSSATGVLSTLAGSSAGIASLAGPFKSLGMGPEMVAKFVPEVLNFVQAKGGDALKGVLANVLK